MDIIVKYGASINNTAVRHALDVCEQQQIQVVYGSFRGEGPKYNYGEHCYFTELTEEQAKTIKDALIDYGVDEQDINLR